MVERQPQPITNLRGRNSDTTLGTVLPNTAQPETVLPTTMQPDYDAVVDFPTDFNTGEGFSLRRAFVVTQDTHYRREPVAPKETVLKQP